MKTTTIDPDTKFGFMGFTTACEQTLGSTFTVRFSHARGFEVEHVSQPCSHDCLWERPLKFVGKVGTCFEYRRAKRLIERTPA